MKENVMIRRHMKKPRFLVIFVREYRMGNQKRTIKRNCQHRVHKTNKNKTKTQHSMCWTPLCKQKWHK